MELYKDNPNVSFVDSDNKPTTDPDKVEWFNGLGFKKGSKYAPKVKTGEINSVNTLTLIQVNGKTVGLTAVIQACKKQVKP